MYGDKTLIERRVGRGAAFLDSHEPGWFLHVNEEGVDMINSDTGPLGQLYGSRISGMNRYNLDLWQASNMGFCVPWYEQVPAPSLFNPTYYAPYNNAWLDEIRRRKKEHSLRRGHLIAREIEQYLLAHRVKFPLVA